MKKQVYYAGCLAAAALLGIGLTACSNEDMAEVSQVEPSTAGGKVVIGGFPVLEAKTRAEESEKTAWEKEDKIYLILTTTGNTSFLDKIYTATYDGSAWSWGNEEPDLTDCIKWKAIYCAEYTINEDGKLTNKNKEAVPGTYEVLCAQSSTDYNAGSDIRISFTRNYSRLHITNDDASTKDFVVFCNMITPDDLANGKSAVECKSFTFSSGTSDYYLYGQFTSESFVCVGEKQSEAVAAHAMVKHFPASVKEGTSYGTTYEAGDLYCLNLDQTDSELEKEGRSKLTSISGATKWKVVGTGKITAFEEGWFCEKKENEYYEEELPEDKRYSYSPLSVTSVDLSESAITSIGVNTFGSFTYLESVVLPQSVTSIGSWAFFGCSSMSEIDLTNVTSIGSFAFYRCSSMSKIDLTNVTEIGQCAFVYCSKLESVTLSEGLTAISESAFHTCELLKEINIPNSVTKIGELAFANCYAMKSLTIGEKVESINERAFMNCTSLEKVTINCSNLTSYYDDGDDTPFCITDGGTGNVKTIILNVSYSDYSKDGSRLSDMIMDIMKYNSSTVNTIVVPASSVSYYNDVFSVSIVSAEESDFGE